MSREKLARLIWKLWKRRNYYKYWYLYELQERLLWLQHQREVEDSKKEGSDRLGK